MKPKTRKTLLILVGIPLLVLGGWIAWLFEGGRVAVALAKHRVRASGLPTTIEEIRPPQVRNEDNAAPVIARFDSLIRPALSPTFKSEGSSPSNLTSMISLMRDDQRSVRNFSFRRDPSFPQAEAAWLVDARKRARTRGEWVSAQLDSPPALAALAVIREAAAKSGYDAQVDYQPGSLPRWPDDGKQLWNGATLLAGHAWLAVERGQTEEACTDAWAMLRLADFFANEPALFRQEIQLSIWRMAVECIEDLAATGHLSPAWNRKFAERLAAMNPARDLTRNVAAAGIIGGEIYFEGILNGKINFYAISPATSWGFPENFSDQVWYGFHGVVRSEYAVYIEWHRQAAAAIAEPGISLPALAQRLKDAERLIAPDRKILIKLLPYPDKMIAQGSPPTNGSLERITLGIGGMINATWMLRARIAAAQIGLALERYRAEKGEYPATLAALVPKFLPVVPANPINGEALRYERVPGGALVHGVQIATSDPLRLWDFGGKGFNTIWIAGTPGS